MTRILIALFLLASINCCAAGEPMDRLPTPHYRPDPSDPPWLADAVQFHGHLGPWAVAGLRAGMAARRAVQAEGYFDLDVTVEGPLVKPPHSCFLDGVQVSTGATMGKRNLRWVEADRIVVRVVNTRTGKVAEVRPTAALIEIVTSLKPRPETVEDEDAQDRDDDVLESLARRIARMPQQEILSVTSAAE